MVICIFARGGKSQQQPTAVTQESPWVKEWFANQRPGMQMGTSGRGWSPTLGIGAWCLIPSYVANDPTLVCASRQLWEKVGGVVSQGVCPIKLKNSTKRCNGKHSPVQARKGAALVSLFLVAGVFETPGGSKHRHTPYVVISNTARKCSEEPINICMFTSILNLNEE